MAFELVKLEDAAAPGTAGEKAKKSRRRQSIEELLDDVDGSMAPTEPPAKAAASKDTETMIPLLAIRTMSKDHRKVPQNLPELRRTATTRQKGQWKPFSSSIAARN